MENNQKYYKDTLCPTCFKYSKKEINHKELYDILKSDDALITQCDECREKGLKVNLDEFTNFLLKKKEEKEKE